MPSGLLLLPSGVNLALLLPVYVQCAPVTPGPTEFLFWHRMSHFRCISYILRECRIPYIGTSDRRDHTSKPKPFMQLRYWSMVDLQSLVGSAALENSMHSSRFAFSSLQTQHGCS